MKYIKNISEDMNYFDMDKFFVEYYFYSSDIIKGIKNIVTGITTDKVADFSITSKKSNTNYLLIIDKKAHRAFIQIPKDGDNRVDNILLRMSDTDVRKYTKGTKFTYKGIFFIEVLTQDLIKNLDIIISFYENYLEEELIINKILDDLNIKDIFAYIIDESKDFKQKRNFREIRLYFTIPQIFRFNNNTTINMNKETIFIFEELNSISQRLDDKLEMVIRFDDDYSLEVAISIK
jgi:hypothetical protein